MIERNTYLHDLEVFVDKPVIKVLTGIHRCGKSSILLLLKEKLLQRGGRSKSFPSTWRALLFRSYERLPLYMRTSQNK